MQNTNLTAEQTNLALDVIHDKKLQDFLLANPEHPDAWALDYVYDSKLQRTIMPNNS